MLSIHQDPPKQDAPDLHAFSAVFAPLKTTTILSLVRGRETAEDIADLLAISLEG
jgi:hypothetical protein